MGIAFGWFLLSWSVKGKKWGREKWQEEEESWDQSHSRYLEKVWVLSLRHQHWGCSALDKVPVFFLSAARERWLCKTGFCCCCLVAQLCRTLLQLHGLQPTRFLCPWDSPGQNTGVGYHFLLQGIFPTQGSKPSLQADLLPLHHLGSPKTRTVLYKTVEFKTYKENFTSLISQIKPRRKTLGPEKLGDFCKFS